MFLLPLALRPRGLFVLWILQLEALGNLEEVQVSVDGWLAAWLENLSVRGGWLVSWYFATLVGWLVLWSPGAAGAFLWRPPGCPYSGRQAEALGRAGGVWTGGGTQGLNY